MPITISTGAELLLTATLSSRDIDHETVCICYCGQGGICKSAAEELTHACDASLTFLQVRCILILTHFTPSSRSLPLSESIHRWTRNL